MKTRLMLILFATSFLLASCGGSKRATTTSSNRNISRPRTTLPPRTDPSSKEEFKEESREEFNKESREEPKKQLRDKPKVVNPVPTDNVGTYVQEFSEIAQEEMRQYGIPASITLAQGVLESGAGNGELVKKANNHFGIKCHDWKGAAVYHDDDEKGECFRKYSLAKFSYRDHSLFLTNRGRYSDLFKLAKDDYKGWAKGLKAAGYATDSKYPDKLIRIVEKYKLYRYDGEVLGKKEKDYKKVIGKNNQHTVEPGETLYRLSKKFKISIGDLKEINGLETNDIFPGQVLYVQPYKGQN